MKNGARISLGSASQAELRPWLAGLLELAEKN